MIFSYSLASDESDKSDECDESSSAFVAGHDTNVVRTMSTRTHCILGNNSPPLLNCCLTSLTVTVHVSHTIN